MTEQTDEPPRRDASRPWYDPNLPPQLATALEIMSRRGRVVGLTVPWEHSRDVPCDEQCVCPVHGTPLIFWPAENRHACRDVNCRHGHGMEADR